MKKYSSTITPGGNSLGWRGNKKEGGGVLFEMGVHAIDLLIYFFGEPKKIMGSHLSKIFSDNVEDAVFSTFIYDKEIIWPY